MLRKLPMPLGGSALVFPVEGQNPFRRLAVEEQADMAGQTHGFLAPDRAGRNARGLGRQDHVVELGI